ncbi:hypothetical protein [Streptomyces sp. NPDC046631]
MEQLDGPGMWVSEGRGADGKDQALDFGRAQGLVLPWTPQPPPASR